MANYKSNELIGKVCKDGGLKHEREFEKFQVNGYVTLEDKKDNVKYKGDFTNCQFTGEGQLYGEDDYIKYSGEFKNGKFDGEGLLYGGKYRYRGEFLKGKFDGYGEISDKKRKPIYKGNFKNGKFDGVGILYDEKGKRKYIGEFSNGQFNGDGVLYGGKYSSRCKKQPLYDGEFVKGRIHGEGLFIDSKGNRYEGNFINGYMSGHGKKTTEEGYISEGSFSKVSINELLYSVEEPTSPVLNGLVKSYYEDSSTEGHFIKNYVNGESAGITYSYDCKGRLQSAFRVDRKTKIIHVIHYRYIGTKTERFELKIDRGVTTYLSTKDNDSDNWTEEESVYWDILFNPEYNESEYIDQFQSYRLMIDALKNKAHTEVNIICPWISYWFDDGEIFEAIESALNRGVKVKIITGYGKEYKGEGNRYEKTVDFKKDIENRFENFKITCDVNLDENHEKMLLCDNDFMMYGSYNLLSKSPDSIGRESMRVSTDPNEIRERRKARFNF